MKRKSFLLCLLSGILLGCAGKEKGGEAPPTAMKSIEQVQNEVQSQWMALPGVVGIGIGDCRGKPCLQVFVNGSAPQGLPKEIQGYAVEVVATGEIRALE